MESMSRCLERLRYCDIARELRGLGLPRDFNDNLKQFVVFDIVSEVVKQWTKIDF